MTDQHGLSVTETAEVFTMHSAIRKLCAAAASRELAERRPELAAWADQAEADLTEAEARLTAPRAALEPLTADLAAVRANIAEHRGADESAPLAARLAARRELAALTDEEAELTARCGMVQDLLSPVLADVNTARMTTERCRLAVQVLDATIASPLDTTEGLATQGCVSYLLATGAWSGHLDPAERNTVLGKASRKLMMDVLRESGMGAEIEGRALAHGKLTEDRKAGVVTDNGITYVSAPGWDGTGGKPDNYQYSTASASAEVRRTRWETGFEPSPGLPVADISGTPADLGGQQ